MADVIVCIVCWKPVKRIVFMEVAECEEHGYVTWRRDDGEDDDE